MIIITHGTDTAKSRNFYISKRQEITDPIILEGKSLEFSNFYQIFEGDSLFTLEKNVFVENLFSSKKSSSEDIKRIVEYINGKKDLNILFWEDKELTKAQQALIKNAQINLFNYPQLLFLFLDSIYPNNAKVLSLFRSLAEQMETELIFYMIVRQFRLMLGIESSSQIDETKRMAPWQESKLSSQARRFSKDKLKSLYNKLYKIDYETKFGLSSSPLSARIDIFLLDL
jgi:DNA polymerase III delta subunit